MRLVNAEIIRILPWAENVKSRDHWTMSVSIDKNNRSIHEFGEGEKRGTKWITAFAVPYLDNERRSRVTRVKPIKRFFWNPFAGESREGSLPHTEIPHSSAFGTLKDTFVFVEIFSPAIYVFTFSFFLPRVPFVSFSRLQLREHYWQRILVTLLFTILTLCTCALESPLL